MAKKQNEVYNPYCLVSFLYWETTGKTLACEKCIFADSCEKFRNAKEFQEVQTNDK